METAVHYDWCRLPGDDPAHDRGNRESLLVGCIDGDYRGQRGVSLQRRIPGAIAVGGSTPMGSPVDKTATNYGREIPAARGTYMIVGLHILVFCITVSVSGVSLLSLCIWRKICFCICCVGDGLK